ncbi:DUF4249 domain-containing protein [bacterium]|nr:DUF4249 domain-containing protein [bacterium]
MKLNKIILVLTAFIALTACEQLVQIDLPQGAQTIAVDAEISTDLRPWKVFITNTQAYYNQDTVAGVEDAIVVISDDDGNVDTLEHVENGEYRTINSRQCVPGRTYTLDIQHNNTLFSASELCRFQYDIDTFLSFFIPETNGFIQKGYYVFEVANEYEPDGDYYLWKIYRNDTMLDGFGLILDEDQNREVSFFNLNIDPNDIEKSIREDSISPRPFPFNFKLGDTVEIEQFCINKKYYEFLIELQNQQNRSGTPFDPPPANPKSNISNGAFGYFSVVNIKRASTIILE